MAPPVTVHPMPAQWPYLGATRKSTTSEMAIRAGRPQAIPSSKNHFRPWASPRLDGWGDVEIGLRKSSQYPTPSSAAYLLSLLTQTKYASAAVSFFACSLQCCRSASKCICSGVGWIAIYDIENCAIAITSNAAVANGFMASFSRVEKKPRTRRGEFRTRNDDSFYYLQPTVTMLLDLSIGVPSNVVPDREASVSPQTIPVYCVWKCSTRSKSPSPSISSSSCAYAHCPKNGEL